MNMNGQHSNAGVPEQTKTTLDGGLPEQETSSSLPETPRRPRSDADATREIADLLGNGDASADESSSGEGNVAAEDGRASGESASERMEETGTAGGEGEARPPDTLKDAAEKLGVDPRELYKLQVSTGDGETVTLGEMKDAWQNRQAAVRETAERAAALDERETALIAEQRVWGEMGESLVQHLTPEQRNNLSEHLRERDARERERMLRVMPELADEAKFDKFRDDVTAALGKYGYQPHEIVVGDHRQLLVLRDLMRAQQRLKELSEYKPEHVPPASKKSQGRGNTPSRKDAIVQKARNARHDSDKIAGIAALLSGQ